MSNVENQIHHYSFALYSIFEDLNDKSFINELEILFNSLYTEKELINILSSNNLNKPERKKIIKNIYENNINEYLVNFLYILIDNNFIHNVLFIIQDFFSYYNKEQNIAFVKILTPYELNKKDEDRIVELLKNKIKKEIVHIIEIDKSLIGGFKIIYNHDTFLDYSIKGKIDELKNQVLNNKGD